jgi:hypothetical protein
MTCILNDICFETRFDIEYKAGSVTLKRFIKQLLCGMHFWCQIRVQLAEYFRCYPCCRSSLPWSLYSPFTDLADQLLTLRRLVARNFVGPERWLNQARFELRRNLFRSKFKSLAFFVINVSNPTQNQTSSLCVGRVTPCGMVSTDFGGETRRF